MNPNKLQAHFNLFLCLVVGIALNILSVSQYRSYVRERRRKDEAYTRVAFNRNENQAAKIIGGGDDLNEISVVVSRPKVLTQKEKNENKSEKNMLKMALTLCSISIFSRILFCFVYIYFVYYNSFSGTLALFILIQSIYTLVYASSIFVFYSFNKMFRQEFKKTFSVEKQSNKIETSQK